LEALGCSLLGLVPNLAVLYQLEKNAVPSGRVPLQPSIQEMTCFNN